MADKIDNQSSDYAAGFRAGAEATKEAAAKVCDSLTQFDMYATSACAEDIRAMPLPEPPK